MSTASSSTLSRRQLVVGTAVTAASALAADAARASEAAPEADAAPAANEAVSADLVVIGGAMAGLCCAVTALEAGCESVVVLEKNDFLGGSTLYAEGVFGYSDRYLDELGYGPYDIDEILQEEIDWSHGVINPALYRDMMADSAEYVNWLLDEGVSFASASDAGTGRYVLHIYDGGNGASAIDVLAARATELGADIRTGACVTELVQDGGVVSGVLAQVGDAVVEFDAPTVVICTGGVGASAEMMDEYTKLDAGKWVYLGDSGATGDGLKLAESTAHGRCKNVCAQNMWTKVDGAATMNDANYAMGMEGSNIWVNQDGVRFINEALAQQFFICNNTLHNQGSAWSVMDQAHVQFFVENGTTCAWSGFCPIGQPMPDVQASLDEAVADDAVALVRADTIEELAGLMGVDAEALGATVASWNDAVATGADEEFGKDASLMFAVAEAPFYAARLTECVLATVGGIRVNRAAQVCAPDGTPVEGLYAAGVCCSGFSGEVYGMAAAGTTQGTAVYLGRVAGRAAAERK